MLVALLGTQAVSRGCCAWAARPGSLSRDTRPRPGYDARGRRAALRMASSTEASPLRTDAMALPTTTRSAALSGEGNGGDGIGEPDVMAAAYGRV